MLSYVVVLCLDSVIQITSWLLGQSKVTKCVRTFIPFKRMAMGDWPICVDCSIHFPLSLTPSIEYAVYVFLALELRFVVQDNLHHGCDTFLIFKECNSS